MTYKMSYTEIIDEDVRHLLTWADRTVTPERRDIYNSYVSSGRIISSSCTLDPTDPFTRTCEIVYIDRASHEEMYAEALLLSNRGLVAGYTVSNMTFTEQP